MTNQQKNTFDNEPSSSSDYLIPVKNINAFMFSEPDVGYINGKLNDCEEKVVSFEVIRNPRSEREKTKTEHTQNPEIPLFDVSFHSIPEPPFIPRYQQSSNPSPKTPGTDSPVAHQKHPIKKVTSRPENISTPDNAPNRFPFEYPDPSEVETYTDLCSFQNAPSSVPSGNFEVQSSNPVIEVSSTDAEKTEPHLFDNFQITIDEAIEQLVCSDPFLSEKELLSFLQQENYGRLKITRRSLKKRLLKNGLENSYKRFRAYIAG